MPKKPEKQVPSRKTETLSIRIDPKVRYGLELMSRVQKRSITGVVEWSIVEAFRSQTIRNEAGYDLTFDQVLKDAWGVTDLERLLALRFQFPTLMSFEEERIARILEMTEELWMGKNPSFNSFRWPEVLPHADKLMDLLNRLVHRTVPVKLTEKDLMDVGIDDIIPF